MTDNHSEYDLLREWILQALRTFESAAASLALIAHAMQRQQDRDDEAAIRAREAARRGAEPGRFSRTEAELLSRNARNLRDYQGKGPLPPAGGLVNDPDAA